MNAPPHRAGHVAVIGRPNVGKSTLVNALVGAKVSIVSPRPQTTRHRLLGIATFPEGQLLLVDTPGIHREQQARDEPLDEPRRARRARRRRRGRAGGRAPGTGTTTTRLPTRRCATPACRWCWWSTRSTRSRTRPRCCRSSPRSAKAAISPACIRSRRSSARAWRRWSKTCSRTLPEQPALYARRRDHRQEPALPRRRAGARAADAPARRGTAVRDHGRDREVRGRRRAAAHRRGDLGRARRPEGDRDRQGRRAPERDWLHGARYRWNACSAARCSSRPGCACAKAGPTTRRRCALSAITTRRYCSDMRFAPNPPSSCTRGPGARPACWSKC